MGLFDDLPAVAPSKPRKGLPLVMASAHWKGLYPPPEDEKPLADEGLGPLELAAFAVPAMRAQKLAATLKVGPKVGAAAQGAAANLGFTLPQKASRGEAPTPASVATDAALGAGAGVGALGLTKLAGRFMPKPSVPAPVPTVAKGTPTGLEPPSLNKFTGQSAQQQTSAMAPTFGQKVLQDPDYLARLKDLGGGRVHANERTLYDALEAGPLDPEAIAAWKAETPINAVEQTRALVTKDYFQQNFLKALGKADEKAADEALAVLGKIEPGIQNIRATGGRTTQAQAMFVQDKVAQAYAELADMRAKGVPFDQVQEAANKKLAELSKDQSIRAAGRKAREWVDALETYATAAKLTSAVTHAVNSVSNALTFLVSRPLEKTMTAGAKLAQGNKAGAAAEVQAMFGTRQGFVDGARRYLRILMEDEPDLGKVSEGATKRFKLPKGLRPLDPFRQLAAADGFWRGALENAELAKLAHASAAKQGLSGPQLAARVTELMNDPPQAWRAKSEEVAREFTFQEDPDGFLKAVSKLREVPGIRLIIPFVQTPYNIGKFQFQRSPLGVVSPRNIRGLAGGGDQQAEAAGRLASGTGLAVAAWSLVKSGDVTGAYPADPAERALWEAEGRPAYSVKIGDRWLAYNRFAPLGLYLGQAAALDDAINGGDLKQAGDLFTRLAIQSGKQILDMPFVSGLSSLMDAIQDPQRSAGRFAGQTVSGLIPNILRDVRMQTDPVRRDARGISGAVRNMIPGVSQGLEPKIDILGREIGYDPNRLARAAKVIPTGRVTPETETMREAKYAPSRPRTELVQKKERLKLEGPESTAFQKALGEATRKATADEKTKPAFAKLDQEDKAKRLKSAIDRARDRVRREWKEQKFKGKTASAVSLFDDLPAVTP